MHKPPNRSDPSSLADQMDLAVKELKDVPDYELAETDLKSLDEVFADLKLQCPQLVEYALEGNYLQELNCLVEILREKRNLAIMAGHWLKQGDEKFNEQELDLDMLRDVLRRVGMNLDGAHMKNFKGEPGELIECHLPPTVAHALYRLSYPLIVSHGLRDLKGEQHPPTPPHDIDSDRFFGRVAPHKPGDVLVVAPNGELRLLSSPKKRPTGDDLDHMTVAIRQEVRRQGHEVASLKVWPTADENVVTVELIVKDRSRPVDNAALKEVIQRETRARVEGMNKSRTEAMQKAFEEGYVSREQLMKALQIPEETSPVNDAVAAAKAVNHGVVDPGPGISSSSIMERLKDLYRS